MVSIDEKIICSLGYLFPLQLLAKFFAIKINLYTDFVKKEIKKSYKLWFSLIAVNIPIIVIKIFDIKFNDFIDFKNLFIVVFCLLFLISVVIMISIVINIIKMFNA